MSLSGEQLCEGVLPCEFATYINYTRSLGFDDRPNYTYLRRLFCRLFCSRKFRHDNVFEWTEKRFHEIYGEANRPSCPVPISPKTTAKDLARRRRDIRQGIRKKGRQ